MIRKSIAVVVFVMVCAPAFGQVKVFVTSQTYTGRLFSFVGADAVCDNLAFQAGLSTDVGEWKAWLSTSQVDARDRMIDARYELLDGTVIADSLADLTDGTLDAPINLDENLATVTTNPDVWTGTAFDGTWGTAGASTCPIFDPVERPWMSEDPARFGGIGRATEMDAGWTRFGGGGNPCDSDNRLYCFFGTFADDFESGDTSAWSSTVP